MKVTVVGGGAAGLSSALVLRSLLSADVTILERSSESETPGLGVALLPFALDELSRLVKQPYRVAQRNAMGSMISREALGKYAGNFFPISRVVQVVAGQSNSPELIGDQRMQDTQYWGVQRAALINMLRSAAADAGIPIVYDADVSEARIRELSASVDLVVGADGAGSAVRSAFAEFRPVSEEAKSRYAWLEVDGTLDRFIFGYIYVAGKGLIRVTAYTHSTNESSAIVTHSMGLTSFFDEAGMLDADGSISPKGLDFINGLFTRVLGGRKLAGKSRWRRFRATSCQRGAVGNVALVGDALATLHYETGWGTSVAMQGSSILGQSLNRADTTLADGLAFYSEKSTEIAKGAIAATLKSMRQVDGQAAKFYQLGPAKFLTLRTA